MATLGTDSLTYVMDAPSDGTPYARQNAAWVHVPPGGIADAPSDGNSYMRSNAAWSSGGTLTGNLNIGAGTANGISIAGSASGSPVVISSQGSDANVAISISPKNGANINLNATYVYCQNDLHVGVGGGNAYLFIGSGSQNVLTINSGSGSTAAASMTLSGTGGLSLPNGSFCTTQAANDSSTKLATTAFVLGQASGTTPAMDGTAAAGMGTTFARADHVHPSDTSRAALAGAAFTGAVTVPTPASTDNSTNAATTAFVKTALAALSSGGVTVSDTPPASPTVGQLWWDSTAALLYVWYIDPTGPGQWVNANNTAGLVGEAPTDGQSYVRQGSTASWVAVQPPLADAPSDGTSYGRVSGAWSRVVNLAGDTMSGLLTLSGAPTAANHAATKAYVDAKPSGPVLLNTLTANNSATLQDLTSLTSAYAVYQIDLIDIVAASNNNGLYLQVHSGGAFQTTSYNSSAQGFSGSSAAPRTITTCIPLCDLSNTIIAAAQGSSGFIRVFNPSKTTSPKTWVGEVGTLGTASPYMWPAPVAGYWNGGNGAIDGFQILFQAGNITSGVVKVYGIP
jgi:hypothetical protein